MVLFDTDQTITISEGLKDSFISDRITISEGLKDSFISDRYEVETVSAD